MSSEINLQITVSPPIVSHRRIKAALSEAGIEVIESTYIPGSCRISDKNSDQLASLTLPSPPSQGGKQNELYLTYFPDSASLIDQVIKLLTQNFKGHTFTQQEGENKS